PAAAWLCCPVGSRGCWPGPRCCGGACGCCCCCCTCGSCCCCCACGGCGCGCCACGGCCCACDCCCSGCASTCRLVARHTPTTTVANTCLRRLPVPVLTVDMRVPSFEPGRAEVLMAPFPYPSL